MLRFFTKEFFDNVAQELNKDEKAREIFSALNSSLILYCEDLGVGFRLAVEKGVLSVSEEGKTVEAEFFFSAPYEEWCKVIKGEAKVPAEITAGRIKFKGSMPKMLLYIGKLTYVEKKVLEVIKKLEVSF